jgi:uncharacterized protein (TIGR03435 family)
MGFTDSGLSRLTIVAAVALLFSKGAGGQPPKFEVVSIRPSAASPGAGTSVDLFEGGRIRIANEPVKLLLRMAFRMQNAQIVGGPAWLDTDRYDIEAKTGRPEKIARADMGPLMQSLLAERFRLQFHRETRELTVGALVAAKGGPKLKAKAEGEGSGMNTSGDSKRSQLLATGTSMELLASYVGNRLDRIVVDKTGLTESYDFTLEWAPDETADSSAPSLITALRDQLGLRIEPRKSPVEVLAIDRIARPSEN